MACLKLSVTKMVHTHTQFDMIGKLMVQVLKLEENKVLM